MVELRQLRYFVCVAELEHFGQAAEELHVVQPALSRQVKQLEEELEVQLFERLPRGVRLTAAGRMLLQRARPILAEVEQMLTLTKLADQGKTGFLRVGFADGATYSGQVPQIIGSFRQRNPSVELELVPASSLEQAELLAREALDVAFVYWLPKNRSGIQHHELNQEQVVLAVAQSNVLARKATIRLADLQNSAFVWFKREHSPMFYDLILSRCDRAGLTLNVVQEAQSESTMLSLVSADMGVTFITESAQRRKPENVILLKVKDLDAVIMLRAMWRTRNTNPALREFLNVVKP
jgi:DNA-binding transcriptional LysR family regulator